MSNLSNSPTTSATQSRLARAANHFQVCPSTSRLLASPIDGRPIAQHISVKKIREGSEGDTMHKLLFVRSGHLDIEGCLGGWIVLPGHMIVIPAERQFNIYTPCPIELDVIHLDPAATQWQHHGCWVAPAKPLAREMIAQAITLSEHANISHCASDQSHTKSSKQKFNIFLTALSTLCPDWFINQRMLFLPSAQSETTIRLIAYMRENIATAHVTEAALHVGLPQRSLHRHCMTEFGLNLRALIREVRIIYAMELLAKSDLSIGAIAQKVGFASMSAFITAFKGRTQLTPGEFLNSTQVAAVADAGIGLTPEHL